MAEQNRLNEEQTAEWIKLQLQRSNKHLAENGVLFDAVVMEESRYLAPYIALWKIRDNESNYYWVLSGDLPVDFTVIGNAEDARGAMKYFSMSWQMKAENIRAANAVDEAQLKYAALLQNRAESMYTLQNADDLWVQK